MRHPIDVVVPVYEARAHVEACLASVLRHARGDWRLVLIDDASGDPQLIAHLEKVAARHERVVLLRNETNRGFVFTANRGMRQAEGRDVVLLNSDTVVTRGFLQKLSACAYIDDSTGLVSPLSNNASLCSVPRFLEENEIPESLTADQFAVLVDRASRKRYPEIVTPVGFCMFIRNDLIERIGFLDEENFPRGYGEENDYSERARAEGFCARLCDDLFIAHAGSASFGNERPARQAAHNDVMDRLHPTYHARVQEFVRDNPLSEVHQDLDRELEGWKRKGFWGRRLRLAGF